MTSRDTADTLFAPVAITQELAPNGSRILRSTAALPPHETSLGTRFADNAERHPQRLLVVEGERRLTWGQAHAGSRALAQALIDRGLGADRPLMILSGNGIEHLLLSLAALTAGIPVMPISPAYSLNVRSADRLRAIARQCRPALVFAEDGDQFAPALEGLRDLVAHQVASRGVGPRQTSLDELLATTASGDVDVARRAVTGATVAKILFTSGSTGAPKGVINTHGMLCANQESIAAVWPFLRDEPPVLVDWLPWSHTFGGNHNLNQVLAFGGTMHLDPGRPTPGLFQATIASLRAVAPTVYYNVPAGWALLAPVLETDPRLRDIFFSRLRFMFYAAAALPESLHRRLREVAARHAPGEIPLTASWGCTESSPAATSVHFRDAPSGCIGVPLPGVEVKLAPVDDKLEIRLRGPSITPGYVDDPEATRRAFDDEGFYRTGDAARLIDDGDPGAGLLFDGRLAEDFKLITGTWVHVGRLRTRLLSETEVLRDAVICGHDRDRVGALAWLDPATVRGVLGRDGIGPPDADLRMHLSRALARLNHDAGSSLRVERLLLLDVPPSIEMGEITDKGYVNQRAVLQNRAGDVEALYGDDTDIILASPTTQPAAR